MSREKQGSKAGRRERHLAREQKMRERNKLRKARAARFAHLAGQGAPAPPALDKLDVARLREIARDAGCEVRSRHRKAELIAMIQDKYEVRP